MGSQISGIQYYYKESDSIIYNINQSVKKFFLTYHVLPKFIQIPKSDLPEFNDVGGELVFSYNSNGENIDLRYNVSVKGHSTLMKNHVWVLFTGVLNDNEIFARRYLDARPN